MKTIELIVRLNVQVPDDLECKELCADFQTKKDKIDGLDILGADSIPIEYSINEWETLEVVSL